MTAPIKVWLEALPDGYRERALRAHLTRTGWDRGRNTEGMSDAVNYAFSWARTLEGADFWSAVNNHYEFREGECGSYVPLPELPTTNKPRLRR